MYLPKAERYTRDGIVALILALPTTGFKSNPYDGVIWKPVGVTLHNTAIPDLKIWESYSQAQKESWGDNLNSGYKRMGWHSGPHFAATPEPWSYVLCDLQADGVHDSCRNSNFFGVETVGNYEVGGDDPNSPLGKLAISSAINIIAALNIRFNFNPDAQDFHRRCLHDHHPCPGSLVTDAFIIGAVKERMAEIKAQPKPVQLGPLSRQTASAETPEAPMIVMPEWPPATDPFFANAARCFNKWKSLGVLNPFALGMTANAEAESSFRILIEGDYNTAFGIYQWHSDRVAAILAGCGIDVSKGPSIEQQVEAAWWELNNTEKLAKQKISDAATAADAGTAACVFFERAGAPMAAARRGAMAERWADEFQQNPKLVTDNPAQ